MHTAPLDSIEASLVEARVHETLRAVAAHGAAERSSSPASRRLAAAVLAIAGRERDLAAAADPQLLACRGRAEVLPVLASGGPPHSHDFITAAVVLTWSGDRTGAYDLFSEARERAVAEGRYHFAVAACERLAHHSILFGDFAQARSALDDACELAARHKLTGWESRCLARAANLALDVEDLARADRLLGDRCSAESHPETRALFAPAGVRLALLCDDAAALRSWTTETMYDLALYSNDAIVAIAAATALTLGAGDAMPLPPMTALALRRGLATIESGSSAPEFLGLAARFGRADESALAAEMLSALFAPQR